MYSIFWSTVELNPISSFFYFAPHTFGEWEAQFMTILLTYLFSSSNKTSSNHSEIIYKTLQAFESNT